MLVLFAKRVISCVLITSILLQNIWATGAYSDVPDNSRFHGNTLGSRSLEDIAGSFTGEDVDPSGSADDVPYVGPQPIQPKPPSIRRKAKDAATKIVNKTFSDAVRRGYPAEVDAVDPNFDSKAYEMYGLATRSNEPGEASEKKGVVESLSADSIVPAGQTERGEIYRKARGDLPGLMWWSIDIQLLTHQNLSGFT